LKQETRTRRHEDIILDGPFLTQGEFNNGRSKLHVLGEIVIDVVVGFVGLRGGREGGREGGKEGGVGRVTGSNEGGKKGGREGEVNDGRSKLHVLRQIAIDVVIGLVGLRGGREGRREGGRGG